MGTLQGVAAVELPTNEPTSEESKKKPVKRTNSFSRRKNKGKGDESGGGDGDGYSGDSDALQKPAFKLEEQKDPLREALQQEAADLFANGEYDEAGEKWYYLAEAANQAGDTRQETTALHNMGTSLVMMGQLFEAARCYVRAFHLASDAQDLTSQVELLESLGWTYTELGYAQRAIECMMLLCQLHEQLGEPEAVVSTLSGLSSLHSAIGEADEAVACLERALADVQEKVPDNLQLRGKIMSELGNVWVQLGNTERGVELYTAALGTAQEAEDPERCMRVHGNLGLALKELGELSQAEEQLQSTVNLARELEDSFMEGRGSMDLAAVYRAKGDLGAALTALRRASELAEQLGDSEACGECYTQLGGLHLLRCEPSQATEQLQLAVAVWQSRADELTAAMLQRRQELGLQVSDDPDLVLLYDDHADTFTLLISALLASAPPGASSPSDAMRALLAAESGRATVLRNLLALGATSPPLAPTEGEQTIPGLEAPTAAAAVARAAPPLELEQISEVLGKLYGESAGPEAGVLVYYALVDDFTGEAPPSLCVWCLSADGGVQTYQGAGAADGRSLNEAAADLHEKLALLAHAHTTRGAKCSAEAHDKQKEDLASRGVLQEGETLEQQADVSGELQLLASLVLHPILAHLPEGAPLTIVPHAPLCIVPFCALPLPDGAPLIERHAISQVPSLTTLRLMLEREEAAKTEHRTAAALVVGCPTALPSLELPSLPSAAHEAEVVAAALDTPSELLLVGEEARATTILAQLAEAPLSVVHLATHSRPRCLALAPTMPDPSSEPTASTAIAEEGAEQDTAPLDEGLLFMDTVSETFLRTHPTVVLTGSHGASGDLSHDYVLGMPRAFLASGARSVLACMWDAVDEPSSALVAKFYATLRASPETSQAEALRAAMLAVRKARSWEPPLFWAGYTLLGVSNGI